MTSSPIYNVADAGILGDGVTDVTTALQDYIDSLAALGAPNNGGELYLPAGVYLTSGLILPSFIAMTGPTFGSGAVLRMAPGVTGDIITIPPGAQFWKVSNVTLDGNSPNKSAGNGLTVAAALGGGSADVTTRAIPPSARYKFGAIENVIAADCAINGFNILASYAIWGSHLFAQGCGNQGFSTIGFDSVYSGLYASGNGKIGIAVLGSNNKVTGAKSIFNGCPGLGTIAGYLVSGYRNTLVACEAQDNYGDGFHDQGIDNQFVACMSDSNGYAPNNTNASSKTASGFVLGGAGGVFSACKITSYRGKLSDGNYATEYPYSEVAGKHQDIIGITGNMTNSGPLLAP